MATCLSEPACHHKARCCTWTGVINCVSCTIWADTSKFSLSALVSMGLLDSLWDEGQTGARDLWDSRINL